MLKKLKGYYHIVTLMIFFSSGIAVAQEVQQGETNGTISFTGVYEPIGSPDPTPSGITVRLPTSEVAKPDGRLPQTNYNGSSRFLWLGILIISFAFLLWKRNNKPIKK